MPEVPPPGSLREVRELAAGMGEDLSPRMRRVLGSRRAFQVKPVVPDQFMAEARQQPFKQVWMRASDSLPDNPFLHEVLLAYISDYELISTATLPHGLHASFSGLKMASLDHAMWFHRPARVDQWLLFDLQSPSASGARGLALGRVYTEDGVLVASLAQEGLIRLRRPR